MIEGGTLIGFLGHLALYVGSKLLVAAVTLALPVIVAMLLVSLAQGLLGRTLPEAELLVLGLPVRLICGLGILIAALPATADFIQFLFTGAAEDGRQLLKALTG